MQLGIFAKTFPRPTLEETLDAVVAHGMKSIQFNMSCLRLATLPDRLDESSCIWIARCLCERGLTMAAISGTFNLCDPHPNLLEHNLRNLDVLAAACRWLDTRIITLCTGTRDPKDMWRWHPENVRRKTWESLVDATKEACKIADRHEVTLAFEPELNNVVNSVAKARRLLDEVGSPWLKVVIDPANLIPPGERKQMHIEVVVDPANLTPPGERKRMHFAMYETLDEAFDWLGPDIVLAHAKDPVFADGADPIGLGETTGETGAHKPGPLSHYTWGRGLEELEGLYALQPERKQYLLDYLAFYSMYFYWLKRISFAGAIVIHGLAENEVDDRSKLLSYVLQRMAE